MDQLHEINPDFKVTFFAIASLLKKEHIDPVIERDFIRLGMHGVTHKKKEGIIDGRRFGHRIIDKSFIIAPCFRPIFKARSYICSYDMVDVLKNRNFVISIRDIGDCLRLPPVVYKECIKKIETNFGIRASIKNSEKYTTLCYHTEGSRMVDDLDIKWKKIIPKMEYYNFKWSEDVAEWI
jgi:hypothetical protein